MKKQLVAVTTGAVLALSVGMISACNPDEDYGDRTPIQFWCQPFTEAETQAWLNDHVREFNNTQTAIDGGYFIKLSWVNEDSWEQKLAGAQSSGTQPEITVLNYAEVALNSLDGQYKALDDYMSESCFTDLLPNVEAMTNVNGSHYIYPWFVEPYSILFYRKSAFTAAGVTAPKSWDELYQAAKKLKALPDYGYGIAMPNANQIGYVLWGFLAQDETSDYYLLSADWETVNVETQFHKQLFQLFRNMYADDLTPAQAFSSYNEIWPLAQGYVPMALGGSWSIGQIKNDYPEVLDDIGYVVCPTMSGNITATTTTAAMGGWGMSIDGKAAHPEACGQFIEWLLGSDPVHLTEFMRDLGYSKFATTKPVEDALANTPEAKDDPFYNFVSENILATAKAEPAYKWVLSEKYANALIKAYKGDNIDTTLAALQTDLEKVLKAGGQGVYPFGDLD